MIPLLIDEVVAVAESVAVAVLPLGAVFLILQMTMLRLPRRQVSDILKGTAIAGVGLFLFLLGIGVGFLPYGRAVGEALGALDSMWLVVAIAGLLGFLVTWGEPAVRILADQVESASSGAIRGRMVLIAVCVGVAAWVGIGMLRITLGIPLLWLLVPAYLVVLVLVWLGDREFVAVAVDAGGVATGPLANSFLLALALGAATAVGADPVVQGFGFVALIAVAPIISVGLLGLLVRARTAERPPATPPSRRPLPE